MSGILLLVTLLTLAGGSGGAVAYGSDSAGALAAVSARDLDCPAEIARYPWPDAEACSVAFCESTYQAGAYNSGNYGLFQLWSGWAYVYGLTPSDLFDERINTAVAYAVWERSGGWAPWGCRP